jgi:hypothetical protein
MRQDDALEVAKLAAMIGGELKKVDQFTIERRSNPANQININNFIAKVRNPSANIPPANYLTQSNEGFASLPEAYVQSQVPDVAPQYTPPVESVQIATTQSTDVPVSVKLNQIPKTEPVAETSVKIEKSVLTRSDVDSIRNSLKSIDKTLAGMLKFLQENSKPKANE